MNYAEACKILGLEAGFTDAELKTAYRRAANVAHPDVGGSDEEFVGISSAYKFLDRRGNVGTPWHAVAWQSMGERVDPEERRKQIAEVGKYAQALGGWRGTVSGQGMFGFQLERLHGIRVGIKLGVSVAEAKVTLNKLYREYVR